jgi:hypothetical protein
MTPMDYQIDLANLGYGILKENAIVYLAMEERTRKTLISILIAEMADIKTVLIITKKKPLTGWEETLAKFKHTKTYTLVNYHMANKVKGSFDLVILDEAHNYISGYPKRSKMWVDVYKHAKNKPIIFISATPYAQTPALLFNQLAMSNWSPWSKYSSFYAWYKDYGTGESKWISGRQIPCYDKVKEAEVLVCCEHLFVVKTRKELGFEQEPKDKIHYIELEDWTKLLYNTLVKDKVIEEPIEIVADTVTVMRTSLHQLEGGTIKTTSVTAPEQVPNLVKVRKEKVKDEDGIVLGIRYHNYYTLEEFAKVQYILDVFGDTEDVAIMYNYIAEGIKLRGIFKKAQILQATSFAEGIELSHVKHLVIYSQDFSTARHTQRRARQASLNREDPILVNYLLVRNGLSEQVYNAVTINKTNYIDSLYERKEL